MAELIDFPEKTEKFGLLGSLGMLIIVAALFYAKPITSIEDIKALGPKEYITFLLCIIGFFIIAVALLRKSGDKSKTIGESSEINNNKFPATIETAIQEQLYSRDFYKENIIFVLEVDDCKGDSITVITELSYYVTNRRNESHTWNMEYKCNAPTGKFLAARFNESQIDINRLDYRYGRGIRIQRDIKAGEKAYVYFKVVDMFRKTDFELYTSYHPATSLKLILKNDFKNIEFDFEVFYFTDFFIEEQGNKKTIEFQKGILPHQGVRLNWKYKK